MEDENAYICRACGRTYKMLTRKPAVSIEYKDIDGEHKKRKCFDCKVKENNE